MSRSLTHLRRVVLSVAVLASLGFGAAQAFGTTGQAQLVGRCPAQGYDYPYGPCGSGCPNNIGYCSEAGFCRCGQIP